MKKFLLVPLVIVLVTGLILGGCAKPAPAPAPAPAPPPARPFPELLGVATTDPGSSGYKYTVAMNRLITKYVEGVTAKEIPTAAPIECLRKMDAGDALLSYSSTTTTVKTNKGFAEFEVIPFRLLFSGTKVTFCVPVLRDSGLKSFADFKGHTVVGIMVPSIIVTKCFETYIKAYGLTLDDMKVLKGMNHAEMIRPLIEGIADATIEPGMAPIATVVELTTTRDCDFVGLDEDKIDFCMKEGERLEQPWVPVWLDANSYKGQTEPKLYLGGITHWGCRPDVSEELAYAVMQAVFDHEEEFMELQPGKTKIQLKTALADFSTPYHPGAIKYYKERGVWTAEHDAKQAKVLKELGWD